MFPEVEAELKKINLTDKDLTPYIRAAHRVHLPLITRYSAGNLIINGKRATKRDIIDILKEAVILEFNRPAPTDFFAVKNQGPERKPDGEDQKLSASQKKSGL
jgi:hypothetical protein